VSRVNVAVAVADDARGRIYEIAAACCALGLHHSGTLALVGVLTGSMESDDLVKLWKFPGFWRLRSNTGFGGELPGGSLTRSRRFGKAASRGRSFRIWVPALVAAAGAPCAVSTSGLRSENHRLTGAYRAPGHVRIHRTHRCKCPLRNQVTSDPRRAASSRSYIYSQPGPNGCINPQPRQL